MCLELLHFQSNINDGRKNVSSNLSIPSSIKEATDLTKWLQQNIQRRLSVGRSCVKSVRRYRRRRCEKRS